MAGESPDRSERERSSGETAEEARSVPPARSGASGEGGASESDAGDVGDARLRAAVAAWVSGAPEEPASPEDGDGADADEESASTDPPVRSRREGSADQPADQPVDQPTTMFGVLRTDDAGGRDGDEAAAEHAERMTTAFFGPRREPRTPVAPEEPPTEAPPSSVAEGPESAAGGRKAESGGPGSVEAPASPSAADGPESATDAASPSPAEGPGSVEASASSSAPSEPESAAGTADPSVAEGPESAAGGRKAEPGEPGSAEAPAEDGEDAPPRDQATTALRVPPAPDAKSKPESKPGPEAKRKSEFVPLRDADAREPRRSADAPPRPTEPPRPKEPPRPVSPPLPAELPWARGEGNEADPRRGIGGGMERTAQQPVPDPPPLDLLAQLTNKPPPPETPLRTAVRRVKIWTPLAVLLAIVFAIAQAVRPLPDAELSLTAPATYTFDGGKPSLPWPSEGQAHVEVAGLGTLGSYGKQKPVPIGSVAKAMTAYVVLQKYPLKEGQAGPKITVDKKAEKGGKRGAGHGGESVLDTIEAGDELTQRDALSALMIPSANNIARLLARWHSGSEQAFVEEMNAAAEELGMADTTYTDPSGLEEDTVSTAADQVTLGKKVMEIPALVDITKQPKWKDPTGKEWRNWNTLVPFGGAIGIKTGSTTAAGGNLLFAGRKEIGGTSQLIVGAVLGQHKPPIIDTANAASRELLDATGATLDTATVVKEGDVVGYVDDQLGGRTPVVATRDVTAVGWGGIEVPLAMERPEEGIPHDAPADEKVGALTVGEGPGQVEVPVALQEDLVEPGFGDKLTRIL